MGGRVGLGGRLDRARWVVRVGVGGLVCILCICHRVIMMNSC